MSVSKSIKSPNILKYASGDTLKIISTPADRTGCGWYRRRLYLNKFVDMGLANCLLIDSLMDMNDVRLAFEESDLLLAGNGNDEMMQLAQSEFGIPTVFDHDDNLFEIQPANEAYLRCGVEDVYFEDKDGKQQPFVVHGITPSFDKYRNMRNRLRLQYSLSVSDMNTSPTKHLSEYWAGFNNKPAGVVPNCIDFSLCPDVDLSTREKNGELRIGWQGGVSHGADFEDISGSLVKAMKKKNTYMYMVGSHYPWYFKEVSDKVRRLPWIEFQAHLYRMASLDLDISVIPLNDDEFNQYKSEIKFSEFAALKVPCLVRRALPYAVKNKQGVDIFCKDEENCLAYDTPEEFDEQLQRLIKDKDLRVKLARNAYEWVRETRDLDQWAPRVIEEIYKPVIERRHEESPHLFREQGGGDA